jgi:hypothetical protein
MGAPRARGGVRFEVDLVSPGRAAAEALWRPFPSRRSWRRGQREAREVVDRLVDLSRDRGITVAIWRETTRDARFGFALGVRWNGVAATAHGDLVAAVWDALPADAGGVPRLLVEQLEAADHGV